jgi:hypothetical protein
MFSQVIRARFSSTVTGTSEQSYVGTAVTLQLATGFTLTVVTIWVTGNSVR